MDWGTGMEGDAGTERAEEGAVAMNNCEGRAVRVFMVMKNQNEMEGTVHHKSGR